MAEKDAIAHGAYGAHIDFGGSGGPTLSWAKDQGSSATPRC